MTKIRNGLVLLLAAGCVLAGLSMMSGPDKPFFDFRTGGTHKPTHTVPSLGPGRKYVTLTIVWKKAKPEFILYTVAQKIVQVPQSEIAGSDSGSWNHNVPYVPGTYYAVGAPSYKRNGQMDCLIAVDGTTYDSDHKSDGSLVHCFINGTG